MKKDNNPWDRQTTKIEIDAKHQQREADLQEWLKELAELHESELPYVAIADTIMKYQKELEELK